METSFLETFDQALQPKKLTTQDQIAAAERQLVHLRLDRLNLGCAIAIQQDEYVMMEKNIIGLEASIHALKVLQSLPTQNP